MVETPKFVFVGKLNRDFFITADQKAISDTLGGSLPYAAVGFKLWEDSLPPGLMARVGEDYPEKWLDDLENHNFDTKGITILPQAVDVRNFYIYSDKTTRLTGDPIPYYSKLGIPFPKALLGYRSPSHAIDSRTGLTPLSIRQDDIPNDYKNATAVHLCSIDYLTHSLMPAVFRQAGFTTLTLDPSPGYMNPTFWNDVPPLITGLTAFLPSEEDLRNLYQGRSEDLWEMADGLAAYGCDIIVIKRGENGQYILDAASKNRWEIPAYDSRIINPTGVGDAFCGGFLAGYRQTYDPVEASLYGSISAASVSEGAGPFFALDVLPGLPQARLERLRQAVRKI